ncbi:MAG: helix-turn-helix transcriptional regulator [Ruminococcaceae bacterium]|nr:helix-turn-helix transcriptional regulator [Oscillospiraceae bacterium]
MEFSERLKKLRTKKGISQAKLAADIHISRSAVAKWENGLGLPSDESLKLLADYFGISIDDLIPNKSSEEIFVSKNKTIAEQKKIIIGFAAGCAIGLFVLGFIFIEPLRESLVQIGLGIICVMLGIFNMRGNIGTIHWYNRRKVTKENQKAYCTFVGLGTLIVGVAIIAGAVIQALGYLAASGLAIGVGVLIGLALILYAQFKYNRGIF